jgi:gas vesicle protein
MPMEKQFDAGSAMLMFVVGAISGAAAMLLLAPASGIETRRYLNQRAREARDRASAVAAKTRDVVQQGKQAAVTTIDEWRPAVASAVEQGRQVVEQGRQVLEQGRQVIEEGKQTVSSAVEQGRRVYRETKARDLA